MCYMGQGSSHPKSERKQQACQKFFPTLVHEGQAKFGNKEVATVMLILLMIKILHYLKDDDKNPALP